MVSCKFEVDNNELLVSSKYLSNVSIASGIISSIAIDKKRLPEKVMAMDMMLPWLKHFREEMNLPKMTT